MRLKDKLELVKENILNSQNKVERNGKVEIIAVTNRSGSPAVICPTIP